MVALQEVNDFNSQYFCFDGFVVSNEKRSYLQGTPFNILSIGSYEDLRTPSVGSCTWIQSFEGKKQDVWYRIGRPATEYQRYHENFVWMADLAKHVIDYIFFSHSAML